MSMKGDVECLNHNIQHDKVNSYLTVVNPIIIMLGLHPYDLEPLLKVLKCITYIRT